MECLQKTKTRREMRRQARERDKPDKKVELHGNRDLCDQKYETELYTETSMIRNKKQNCTQRPL